MNAGAEVARGDILCFLHADTRIPGYLHALLVLGLILALLHLYS